jgi:hypothetical protein
MKKLPLLLSFLLFSTFGFSQVQASLKTKLPVLDKSPMDMTYYPANYPVLKIQDKASEPLLARVIYSRPQKDNRKIFGELVEYNTIWRLGANEATEIDLYKDVKINGKKLAKGRYTVYAIPTADKWTMIFNKDTDTWGAFKYDEKKDVLRVDLPTQKSTEITEAFTIGFAKSATGADMIIAWDDTYVTVPFSVR